MRKPFLEIDAEHFTIASFDINPIKGYKTPVNDDTGGKYPNCCPRHKGIFEDAQKWHSKFPNCCDKHKAMKSKWWFKEDNYVKVVEKIVTQLSYTEFHISEQINIDDWYKDITDYIEYNVSSFGHPPVGLELYLGYLKHYVENEEEIPKYKRKMLIDFIGSYYQNSEQSEKTKKTEKTDFNLLYSTYQKWLNTFPFEISFFANIRPHFEKQFPILNGKPETNKYSGITKAKLHTQSSLINELLSLTKNILQAVNITELRKKGVITDIQANKLEFAEAELNTKIAAITKQFSKGELKYVKTLKKWLQYHKEYFNNISPLLENVAPQPFYNDQNRTKIVITGIFENMDRKGWEYAFSSVKDYELFTDLLTNFFEYKKYSIPKNTIKLKRTSKTKVAKALGEIHKELSESPLNSDTEYFKIAKVLNHFKEGSNFDLAKAMQR